MAGEKVGRLSSEVATSRGRGVEGVAVEIHEGTVAGPVLGAILFGYLQIKMLSTPALRDSNLFLYGGLLVAVMLFEPKGLVGLFQRLRRAVTSPRRAVSSA